MALETSEVLSRLKIKAKVRGRTSQRAGPTAVGAASRPTLPSRCRRARRKDAGRSGARAGAAGAGAAGSPLIVSQTGGASLSKAQGVNAKREMPAQTADDGAGGHALRLAAAASSALGLCQFPTRGGAPTGVAIAKTAVLWSGCA